MSISRVKRGRGLPAVFPECMLLSSFQQQRKGNRASLPAILKKALPASALLAAAFGLPAASYAQEAQPAGSQEQVSTLPPVSVVQPKTVTPASQRPRSESGGGTSTATEGSQQTAVTGPVTPGAGGAAQTGIFGLGGINLMGGTVITNQQTWYFSKPTLDAALDLAPGVNASPSGGPRNEGLIFVRGFNRWQVPLYIDGVRIYLPYDNRLDFTRFQTADIAEIQIAKGYASVLDGPGAIGGAINLVTKRPTKEYEAEIGETLTFGRDGSYEGYSSYASVGTRQKYWYLQVTGTVLDSRGWMLSEDFKSTPYQASGWRDNSKTNDWRINAKLGVTPNATDEYTISLIHQEGSKGAPVNVTDPSNKYWTWPYWDVNSVYLNTTTKIGTASYVNTKAFYNYLNNSLYSYDDASLTAQKNGSSFDSYYGDTAYGGSIDAGTDLTKWDTLKGAFFYRRDQHTQYNDYFNQSSCATPNGGTLWNGSSCKQPLQTSIEDTYSVAGENTVHATRKIDFVTGVSYDWRNLERAQDWSSTPITGATVASNGVVNYPTKDGDAFNWQTALIYRYTNDAKVYASVSDRTRFPTLFERFSSRFGAFTGNPALLPEEATNYEIGWAGKLWTANVSTAVFYSDTRNLIEGVNLTVSPGKTTTQNQNVGHGYMEGWEAAADIPLNSKWAVGGNVTLMRLDISSRPSNPVEITGVPDAKGIAYVKWRPLDALTITPNVEIASDRWTQNTAGNVYYKLGAYTLANVSAEYTLRPGTTVNLTVRNMFDLNYSLADGTPEPGRTITAGFKMKF